LVALRLLGLEPLLQLMLGLELPLRLWIFVTHGRSRLKVLRLRLEAGDGGKIAGQNRAVPSYPRPVKAFRQWNLLRRNPRIRRIPRIFSAAKGAEDAKKKKE
jgi:hypothetical protein